MLKRYALIIFLAAIMIFASSCGLFKCKHKEYDEKTVAPTCTSEGYTEHTCKKCGESYRDSQTSKLAHAYSSELVASDCFKEGYTKYTCTACGDSYTDIPTAKTTHYFAGEACPNCGMAEITENITPNTEWYNEEDAIFTLTTKEQLAGLSSLVNSGNDFSNKKIYLDADINLEYYEWIPIGNADNAFNGIFSGEGHTISGLKINANYDYVGLFGKSTGKLYDFNVVEANVYLKLDHNYVSILCGYSTGEIKNITTEGFIEAPKSDYVGAISGAAAPASMEYINLNNSATIKARDYVGGIFGHINASGSLQTNSIKNTGDITGSTQVGGAFGYVYGGSNSKIYNVTSSADVVADYYVGGLIGKVENVHVSECSNEGSTVTANSYYTSGSEFYVWLGGYIGYGASIEKCTNNVDINYSSRGFYVGGIMGYATSKVTDCTNNGAITTYTNYVGGISGYLAFNNQQFEAYKTLTNNGEVTGKDYVGGIAGVACQQFQYLANLITTATNLYNSASVKGENYVGGIMGYCIYENTHRSYGSSFAFTEIVNTGAVSGISQCGELLGIFSSDGGSSVVGYTVTGKITINGEVLEGTYDVGTSYYLTLSGREIYGEENTEATE